MTRETTAAYDSANDAAHFDEVIFAELQFASGTSYVCTREHDVDWNSITWAGKGQVGTIEPIEEAGELEPLGIAMTLKVSAELLALALDPSEYKNRDCKIWRGLLVAPKYLSLPGTSGNYASTPDGAAVSITGDIDLRVKVALDDWVPAGTRTLLAKWATTAGTRSFMFRVLNSGLLSFAISTTGSDFPQVNSSIAPTVSDGADLWVRVTRVQATGVTTFYTSDDGETWTQLGTTATLSAGSAIWDSPQPVELGSRVNGTTENAPGKFYYAELRNGIAGDVVASPDFTQVARGVTSFQDAQGNTWTINGSDAAIVHGDVAVIADPVGPFTFRMDSLEFELGRTGTLRLTAEGRLADWQRPRVRYYNDADQQAEYPGDNFFANTEEFVEKTLIW
jgi:hypothetical protein